MNASTTTTIRNLCSEAGLPAEDIEQVIEAVGLFHDEPLQLRAAQDLADAWKRDHATTG